MASCPLEFSTESKKIIYSCMVDKKKEVLIIVTEQSVFYIIEFFSTLFCVLQKT